jgi:hypothetical protein
MFYKRPLLAIVLNLLSMFFRDDPGSNGLLLTQMALVNPKSTISPNFIGNKMATSLCTSEANDMTIFAYKIQIQILGQKELEFQTFNYENPGSGAVAS